MTWTVDSCVKNVNRKPQNLNCCIPCRYLIMTSSNGNIFLVTGPLCGVFTGHRWILTKASRRGAFMFSLTWTNAWVSNRGAGDLRRNRAHYDVIIIKWMSPLLNGQLLPISTSIQPMRYQNNIGKRETFATSVGVGIKFCSILRSSCRNDMLISSVAANLRIHDIPGTRRA